MGVNSRAAGLTGKPSRSLPALLALALALGVLRAGIHLYQRRSSLTRQELAAARRQLAASSTTHPLRTAQQVLRREPTSAEGWMLLGETYLHLGRDEDALAALLRAQSLNPRLAHIGCAIGECCLRLNRQGEALAALRGALARQPDCPQAVFRHGETLRMGQRYREAAVALERAARMSPENGFIWTRLGRTYLQMALLEKAEAAFRRGIALAPENPEPGYYLAVTLYRGSGKPVKSRLAVRYALQAVEQDPDNSEARALLGCLYSRLRRPKEAEAALRAAVRLNDRNSTAHYALGQLLIREGRAAEAGAHLARSRELHKLEAQLQSLQSRVVLSPQDAGLHAQLAAAFEQAGQPFRAEQEWREAIRRRPGWAAPHQRLAALARGMGRTELAAREEARAKQLQGRAG